MQQRVLTTGQVAKYCGVNFRTVIRWIDRGQLTAYKLPGRGDNRIEVDQFIRFLKAHGMPIPAELDGSSQRVLIVDEDANDATRMRHALDQDGWETHLATSGFEAGALLCTYRPAVVIMEPAMSTLGGFEAVRTLRRMPHFNRLKLLVVSAIDRNELDQALVAGADAVLSKPVMQVRLARTVRELVSNGNGARAATR